MSQVLPMAEPLRTEACARVFVHTLSRLGFVYRCEDGSPWPVRFQDVAYYPAADAAFLDVDVHRLPRKVTTLDLARADVVHELSTAIGGYPVTTSNTSGLVYVVRYAPPAGRAALPRRAPLDLAGRPAKPYAVPLGVDGRGVAHWESLLFLLNVLVGGEPGAGKSMLLNAWLMALTQAHGPAELRVSLVDPKRVELHGWRHLPHLVGQIAEGPGQAEALLDLLRGEIDERGRLFQAAGVRSLAGYNQGSGVRDQGSGSGLPLHLVVIDELTDLTIQAGGPRSAMFRKLIQVASTGRALGIQFVVATQSPRAEIVDGNLKAALNTRIAFRTASRADSRVILDRPEAAEIAEGTPGRMVLVQGGRVRTLQGFMVDDATLRAVQPSRAAALAGPLAGLTADERRVLRLAVGELGGAFRIKQIYARLGPRSEGGVSQRWLEDVAKRWTARGWLVDDASDPTQARRVAADVATAAAGLADGAGA
jgi:hypothetical protein